ncbi:hypothetical protein H310_01831 [Aphanomyces invadans]|uniref:Uncharacterized protein n=1 Tax=Aphanomyces invadans TaxID=157072 RepID=A0A024UNQ1_9STRA|nr:hypothetical protein H310_01831 [Aphanomyces invadans]ETW07268.1 hypothetical protein H310_01831 [Aphanomyces invadans]|eukprot:XP_008863361.1 hypothetical protein H310_01831 [Aphanomyces invadans]
MMKRPNEGHHTLDKHRRRSCGWMFTSTEEHLAAYQRLERPVVARAIQLLKTPPSRNRDAPHRVDLRSDSSLRPSRVTRSGLMIQVLQSKASKSASLRSDSSPSTWSIRPQFVPHDHPALLGNSPRSLPVIPATYSTDLWAPIKTSPFFGFTQPCNSFGSVAADAEVLLDTRPICYTFSSPFVPAASVVHVSSIEQTPPRLAHSAPLPPSSPLPYVDETPCVRSPVTLTPHSSPIAVRGTLSPSVQPLINRLAVDDAFLRQRRAIAFRQITTPSPSKRKMSHRATLLRRRPPRPSPRPSLSA